MNFMCKQIIVIVVRKNEVQEGTGSSLDSFEKNLVALLMFILQNPAQGHFSVH